MNQRIAKKIAKHMLRGDRYFRRTRRIQALLGSNGYSRHQASQAIATISTDRLRGLVEVPVQGSLWAQVTTFTPVLVSERFGDGRKLMYLSPINDRPAYFVVRVDSRSDVYDYLDDVYLSAEEEHGGSGWCQECDHDVDCCDEECCFERRHFPYANFNDGSSWSFDP